MAVASNNHKHNNIHAQTQNTALLQRGPMRRPSAAEALHHGSAPHFPQDLRIPFPCHSALLAAMVATQYGIMCFSLPDPCVLIQLLVMPDVCKCNHRSIYAPIAGTTDIDTHHRAHNDHRTCMQRSLFMMAAAAPVQAADWRASRQPLTRLLQHRSWPEHDSLSV